MALVFPTAFVLAAAAGCSFVVRLAHSSQGFEVLSDSPCAVLPMLLPAQIMRGEYGKEVGSAAEQLTVHMDKLISGCFRGFEQSYNKLERAIREGMDWRKNGIAGKFVPRTSTDLSLCRLQSLTEWAKVCTGPATVACHTILFVIAFCGAGAAAGATMQPTSALDTALEAFSVRGYSAVTFVCVH